MSSVSGSELFVVCMNLATKENSLDNYSFRSKEQKIWGFLSLALLALLSVRPWMYGENWSKLLILLGD